jgi:predicted nuclease of restriction endonuclease-like RecB superfamily
LLPVSRIQVYMDGKSATPVWLGAEDYVWLRALLDDFARLDGKRQRDILAFLKEPLRVPSPPGKRLMALWILQHMCSHRHPSLKAGELRDAMMMAAQRDRNAGLFRRSDIMAEIAAKFGLTDIETEEGLFSDLPMEQRLALPDPIPDPPALAAETNMALAQGILKVASEVTINLYGGVRAVVRQVQLRRLLHTVEFGKPAVVQLHISGAFSLFHHTTMYGHALASILLPLLWCDRFDLGARCILRGREVDVSLNSNDPIARRQPPRQYDSRVEELFARDFRKTCPDWDLIREPEPLAAEGKLVFPDFAIVHRRDTTRKFLLEIVGFWTADYLREKLQRLRCIQNTRLILCINRALNCGDEELPAYAQIVWFHKRIDPAEVLAAIEKW